MSEPEIPQESNDVCESWQQMVQAVLGFVLLLGAVGMFHYYAPRAAAFEVVDEGPLFLGAHAVPGRDLAESTQTTHATVTARIDDARVVAGRRRRITAIRNGHQARIVRGLLTRRKVRRYLAGNFE
jgi:hypothetical protein